MIEIPAFGGDVSLLEGVSAVSLFVSGYIIHEVLHWIPLRVFGHDTEISILPTKAGQSRWQALLAGTVVDISIHDAAPRSHVVISALAPLLMAIFPVYGLALALARPVVDIGTFLVLFAWFAVSIPSPRDWSMVLRYRPDMASPTEVSQHG